MDKFDLTDEEHPMYQPNKPIRIVHAISTGEPICPKCGKGLESEGGSVVQRGSWDCGPLWWECEDDGEQWGHA